MLANRMRMSGIPLPFVDVITSSRTWKVPPRVDKVDITVIGGGQGGSGGTYTSSWLQAGSGCNGGEVKSLKNVDVRNIKELMIIIGAGGAGGVDFNQGAQGGSSSVKNGEVNILSCVGGKYGVGSAGGEGGESRRDNENYLMFGGRGGADGNKGYSMWETTSGGYQDYGLGQGYTTRGVNNILYSGGGGGGGISCYIDGRTYIRSGRPGGDGGGGSGSSSDASAAESNTGGGGGGGGARQDNKYNASSGVGGRGGSGVVIIKWNGAA